MKSELIMHFDRFSNVFFISSILVAHKISIKVQFTIAKITLDLYSESFCFVSILLIVPVVVVVLGYYVSPTAKVIRRRDLGLKSHPKDWRSPGSNSRPLD